MATQVQNRRGTTAEHSTFTGAVGEVTIDTDKDTVVVHDGATAGGRPLLREDQSNLPTSAPTTGIYNNSGSLAISTNSLQRLAVDASGNINIDSGGVYYDAVNNRLAVGTTSPAYQLSLGTTVADVTLALYQGASDATTYGFGIAGGQLLYQTASAHAFRVANSEVARIDSSGRLLVGTSSARSNFFNTTIIAPTFQLEEAGVNTGFASFVSNRNDTGGSALLFGKTRGTTVGSNTVVSSGDDVGAIFFSGADGSELVNAASITAQVDGTPGANDMPGRLVFSTTADGASSPTERMRITAAGIVQTQQDSAISTGLQCLSTNGSFAGHIQINNATRAANSAYTLFRATSGHFADQEFILRGDGQAYADGSWNGGGADYAEYFEWSDSNPDEEDRRGISVVLDGEKIREAVADEDPIGVISGNPSVVGDAAWNKWSGKYLRDEFGTYIQEDYEVTDEDGNTVIQQRRKLNPAYDPDQPYESREDRPEWDCVGLMGKLRIRKGQVTGSRWIKMRDISDSVEEWLVR